MRLRLFLVGAIVLIVFAVIATSNTSGAAPGTGTLFSVQWYSWLCASFLSFLTDIAVGGWGYANGAWGRDQRQPVA